MIELAQYVQFTDGERWHVFKDRDGEPGPQVHPLVEENRKRGLWFVEPKDGGKVGGLTTVISNCYYFPKGWCDEMFSKETLDHDLHGYNLRGYGPAYMTPNSAVAEMTIPCSRIERMEEITEEKARKFHPALIEHLDKIDSEAIAEADDETKGKAVKPYMPPRPLPAEWFSKRGFERVLKDGWYRRAANVTTGGNKQWLVLYVKAKTGAVELSGDSGEGEMLTPMRIKLMGTVDREEDLDALITTLHFDDDLSGPEAEARGEEYAKSLVREKWPDWLWDVCAHQTGAEFDYEISAFKIPLSVIDNDCTKAVLFVYEDGGVGVKEMELNGRPMPGVTDPYVRLPVVVRSQGQLPCLIGTLLAGRNDE